MGRVVEHFLRSMDRYMRSNKEILEGRLCVAFSGGPESVALAAMLTHWYESRTQQVRSLATNLILLATRLDGWCTPLSTLLVTI